MNDGIFLNSPLNDIEKQRLSHLTDRMPRNIFINTNSIVDMPYHFPTQNNWQISNDNLVLIFDTTKDSNTVLSIFLGSFTGILYIDWGDNTTENFNTTGTKSHNYKNHGIYTVQIKGNATRVTMTFNNKLIAILSFGKIGINNLSDMFTSCPNLMYVPYEHPIVSSFVRLFQSCTNFNSPNITNWKTSNVTNFTGALSSNKFNYTLNWDVSNGTSFLQMFVASAFNQDIGHWNVSKATIFGSMFNSSAFNNGNSPSISGWNTSNVTDMGGMFQRCVFNQPIGSWDVSKVTSFSSMFQDNNIFDQDIGNWNISGASNLIQMFFRSNFNNGNSPGISGWNTSNVTSMSSMFRQSSFNQPIQNWNVNNVTNMEHMFTTTPFDQNLDNWNVSKVTNFSNMFNTATSFNSSLSGWQLIANNVNCSIMFQNAISFQGIGLDSWNTSGVVNMNNMFRFCNNLSSQIQFSNWDVSKVTNFASMFSNTPFFNGNLSGWQLTASGVSCSNMFNTASSFIGSGLDSWNTSGVTDMSSMFRFASNFNYPIGSWNTSKVTNFTLMFQGTKFNYPIDSWDMSSATSIHGMFPDCPFNQPLNSWNTSKVTIMSETFNRSINFNQYLGSWDTSSATTIRDMFNGATAFKGSGLENWNLARLNASTSLNNFALGCNFPSGQYDLILNSWNNNKASGVNGIADWRTALSPHFGSSKYTAAASGARASLVSYGWTITDGGLQT